jgi:archaellum component FlaC
MPETLDTLGAKVDAMIGRFDGVDKRFDGIDKRFDGVDKRFDGIDKRLDGMDKRFDGIDKGFDEVKSELGVKIEAVEHQFKLVIERLDDVLKKDVANSVAHVRLDARIDDHDLRILALEGRRPTDEG